MKSSILLELARRWEEDAAEPVTVEGSDTPENRHRQALGQGVRSAKRECADALKMLVSLLGSKD